MKTEALTKYAALLQKMSVTDLLLEDLRLIGYDEDKSKLVAAERARRNS